MLQVCINKIMFLKVPVIDFTPWHTNINKYMKCCVLEGASNAAFIMCMLIMKVHVPVIDFMLPCMLLAAPCTPWHTNINEYMKCCVLEGAGNAFDWHLQRACADYESASN